MFRFENTQAERYLNSWTYNGKTFVKCSGPGPHSTNKGTPNLVVGFHRITEVQKGTGIYKCKSCMERTGRTWLPKDYGKPIGHDYLTEEERTQLRTGLAELRKTFAKMEDRTLNQVDAGRTEPTARQGKL